MSRLVRLAFAALALTLFPLAAGAVSIRYKNVPVTFVLKPRFPLPAGASTYSLDGGEDLGLAVDHVAVGGMTRVAKGGDLRLTLSGSPPQVGVPRLGSFVSEVHVVVQNKNAPPQYQMTVRWATVPVNQPAKLIAAAGSTRREYDVGAELLLDVGPKPETSSGMFQASGSQWTIMQNEPAANPQASVSRAKWVAENFCADVTTLVGEPQLETKDGRGAACVQAKLKEASGPASLEKVRAKVLERVNATLEREVASGERSVNQPMALVEDDARFEQAYQALQGAAPERYQVAAAALLPAADDASAKPRVRAAALFGLALCQVGSHDLASAQVSLARSKETNAQEGDGWFGSSGKDLGKQIDVVEKLVAELVARESLSPNFAPPAKAPAAVPIPAAAPAPAAATPASAPGKPWVQLSDDEFMAAYPGLIQAASARKDRDELAKLGTRMSEVMVRRTGTKR